MGKLIDLTGQVFGRWTVLGISSQRRNGCVIWFCRCECGAEKLVSSAHLRNGNSRQCCVCSDKEKSRKQTVDLVRQRYGRLVVVKQVKALKPRNGAYWLCQCDCGNTKVIRGSSLRSGATRSCGCLGQENRASGQTRRRLPLGEACLRHLFASYRRGAETRGLAFELTKEQFHRLTKMNCWYCGAEPAQAKHLEQCHGDYIYNGIDRVDNEKGYTPENCVPCCFLCNQNKRAMGYDEFLEWIHKIANNRTRHGASFGSAPPAGQGTPGQPQPE